MVKSIIQINMGRIMRIGYMGIPFSNSEEASQMFVRIRAIEDAEYIPLMTSRGVVDALSAGQIDLGVVAYRNIAAGPVSETEEALAGRDDISRVATVEVPIHHCVFLRSEGAEVKDIASHPQALMQTAGNLDRLYPGTGRIECEDTAEAAKMLTEGRLDASTAVICRKDAGESFGLYLAYENIEDRKDNMTTFLLLSIVC